MFFDNVNDMRIYQANKNKVSSEIVVGILQDWGKRQCDNNKGYKAYTPNGIQICPMNTQKSIDEIEKEGSMGKRQGMVKIV